MIVAIALVLIAGAAVLAAAGVGAARSEVDDGAGRIAVVLGGAVVLAVVLVGVATGIGVSGVDGSSRGRSEERTTAAPREPVPLRAPAIELRATSSDRLPPVPPVVGDLEDGDVLVIGLSGLGSASRATVHQCRAGSERASECRPGVPVNVSEHERAVVLVDLDQRFEPASGEPVDCAVDACSIVVFGTARLEAITTFGRPAAALVTVAVEPPELAPGATVAATASHVPPGSRTSFAVCRPGGRGMADCGPPTPAVLADAAGTATAPVAVAPGRCPRGATCAIAVTVDGSGPRAYAALRLTGRSGATYDDGRLGTGILLAALLLVIAFVLLRRTDWTPVEGDPFAHVELPDDPFAEAEEG